MRIRVYLSILAVLLLCGALKPAQAQLTINTSSATDWKIANGAISMDWDSTGGSVWSMYLTGYSTDLVDTTHIAGNGHPSGLYMDNTATGFTGITSAPSGVSSTAGYSLVAGSYLDWWISWPATSSSPWAYTQHFLVQPNDPTLYVYTVTDHPSSSGTATWGQLQYVYRINQTEFNNTYQYDSGLNGLGGWSINLPSEADLSSTDPGRAVENAVEDLHGFADIPAGFGREFYTKYDYASYEYLLQANGNYGPNFGAWAVFPTTENLAGGPTKQIEVYTGNILMGELLSGHLDNEITYSVGAGENTTRIWGPMGFHFNRYSNLPAMLQDALDIIPGALTLFNKDAELISAGYVPTGSSRGTLEANIGGAGSASANTAWTVLSDQFTNMQYSIQGAQYWAANNSSGSTTIDNVIPGTYRLESYVLGKWGELRDDGVNISAGSTTTANLTFSPENFSTSPIWTIGTPDRSAHEFLHGENNYGSTGSCPGCDDKEYSGNWNYWKDFEANDGAVVYYATAVGSTPATNNPLEWNYVQWGEFDPGLYAGIDNSSDDTTDGYKYIIPSYVSSVTATVPPWQVHFATTSAQNAQGSYVDLSVGLAANESDLTASLNGHPITWHAKNRADADARSGLSGYYQWMVFEWPTSDLVAAGGDNDLTLSVSGGGGNLYDALRMEISAKGANPSVTNWHDYEYISSNGTDTSENPAVSNNNTGTVVVGQSPSFTLSPSPSSLSVAQGASATDTIAVTEVDGFSGSVELSVSALPSGVTAGLGTDPTIGSSVLTFAASSAAPTGTSTVTITGTSGSLTATTSISLSVTNSGVCTPTAITPYIQVNGAAWVEEATATVASGATVNLGPQPTTGGSWSWIGPNGFTSTSRQINDIPLTVGTDIFIATFTNTASCIGKDIFTITVTGSGGGFTLAPSASSVSIAQGGTGSESVTVTDTGGFTGSVTLAVSGLPSGVTAAFGTNPTTTSSVVTLTASSTATPGTYPITVSGTSGTLTGSTSFNLIVTSKTTGSGCTIDYTILPQNSTAFGAAITIVNDGNTALSSWALTWSFANGQTVSSLWNGNETQSGANVAVTNESYNGSIPAGGSYTGVGFNGTWNGVTNAIPTSFSLDGTACTVN
jgi:hypothetical protein